MSIETAHFFTPIRLDHPYAGKLQVAIPSLGTYYDNLRMPDLLLTVLYRLDAKTGDLVQNPKFIFQTDGPSTARLNFKHETLERKYAHRICNFHVNMDAIFGEGVVHKSTGKVSGNIGAEKVVKGGLDVGVELSDEVPGVITSIHALIYGTLNAKDKTLEAWGEMQGAARMNRSY